MGLFFELLAHFFMLALEPFTMCKLIYLVIVRSVALVTLTWLRLVKDVVRFQVHMCWRISVWVAILMFLPFRVLTALQRERQLLGYVNELKTQLGVLIWEKEELAELLDVTRKKCSIMEMRLAAAGEEQEQAVERIQSMEIELSSLKEENCQLKENWGKAATVAMDVRGKKRGPWDPDFSASGGLVLPDFLMQSMGPWDVGQSKFRQSLFSELQSRAARTTPHLISCSLVAAEELRTIKYSAILQSLFSTVLSLLVGMVIWKSKEPCMPLVAALFIVVGISLKSVAQFFSSIKVRPASDAVALLSFNCFILGTITYPALPAVGRLLVPTIWTLVVKMVGGLGFT